MQAAADKVARTRRQNTGSWPTATFISLATWNQEAMQLV